ncbi:MAG: methyltransferase domain-containing protein [Candidatus Bipolaricaulota bacterium]|nr:methyltransferase domain-containing protein [Candidatus Bipolaricaulota bacterium]MCS7275155.1 methyltransferase domain-containing protein [Candidatus Bipolaricaulota bacterium]MDW8111608.1 methyltransferase domain-containing protein [Candidatus Bipolaricaulota bacterium]MDW8329687.1 methyltransferase domain-containing protein [Candidatus Bipolaricaulota bacterium]
MKAKTPWLQQRIIGPLIDLSYLLMSLLFVKGFPWWYERLNAWHYRFQAQRYDQGVIASGETRYAQALEAGLQALSVHPSRILDVNTGTGFVAQKLLARFPHAQIVATDLSEAMLAHARQRSSQIEFVRADTARLPFADESFDLVTLHNGPPHLGEMTRVLRPGGQLLIAFTSGARVPALLLRRWLAHAQHFGKVEMGRTGDGLWLILTKEL